jgi:hypothetical protein
MKFVLQPLKAYISYNPLETRSMIVSKNLPGLVWRDKMYVPSQCTIVRTVG